MRPPPLGAHAAQDRGANRPGRRGSGEQSLRADGERQTYVGGRDASEGIPRGARSRTRLLPRPRGVCVGHRGGCSGGRVGSVPGTDLGQRRRSMWERGGRSRPRGHRCTAPPGQRRKGAQPRDRPKTAVDLRPALARGQGQSQPHVITPSQRGTRALVPITKGGPLAPIPRVGCVLWSGHKLPDRHGWGRGAAAGNTRPILQHTRKEDRQAPTPGASDARTASGPPLQRGPHEHTARRAAPSAPRREQRRDQNQP